jgi:nucleotide-binding universal stress UspA family protein
MYKTILVPIDMAHIEKGKAMIDTAKAQRGEDAQVILLNVVEVLPAWVASQLPSGILDQSRQSTLEELRAIADAANINADVEVRAGHPYKTILEVADKTGAELIIIASHLPGLEDYFLGSTAAKVVRHAKCSVLVVR